MDLSNIHRYVYPTNIDDIQEWDRGYSWLGGGTWLFSETQPDLNTLVDLQGLGWSEIEVSDDFLVIGATCRLIELCEFAWLPEWTATSGFLAATSALAASMKVINVATIGGNLCLALSVGTFAPLMVALDAKYEIWDLTRRSRYVAAKDFQTGSRQTVLQSGEVLRRILIPVQNLTWRLNYQKLSLATIDPALAIAVSTCNPECSQIRVVIAASVVAASSQEILLEDQSDFRKSQILPAFLTAFDRHNYIHDFKASDDYRRAMTKVLIKRSLDAILDYQQ